MALNKKQQQFVAEYLKDLNATQAAIRAGYSEKTARQIGNRLLTNVDIQNAIKSAMADRSEKTGITQDYVLTVLRETVERCRQVAPVLDRAGKPVLVETDDGELRAVYEFDAKNVLKGAELLGKHLGLFDDRHPLDLELKRLDIERRRMEIESLRRGNTEKPLNSVEAATDALEASRAYVSLLEHDQ